MPSAMLGILKSFDDFHLDANIDFLPASLWNSLTVTMLTTIAVVVQADSQKVMFSQF